MSSPMSIAVWIAGVILAGWVVMFLVRYLARMVHRLDVRPRGGIFVNRRDFVESLLGDLAEAKELIVITCSTCFIDNVALDPERYRLREILRRKRAEGVQVRVLMDGPQKSEFLQQAEQDGLLTVEHSPSPLPFYGRVIDRSKAIAITGEKDIPTPVPALWGETRTIHQWSYSRWTASGPIDDLLSRITRSLDGPQAPAPA